MVDPQHFEGRAVQEVEHTQTGLVRLWFEDGSYFEADAPYASWGAPGDGGE